MYARGGLPGLECAAAAAAQAATSSAARTSRGSWPTDSGGLADGVPLGGFPLSGTAATASLLRVPTVGSPSMTVRFSVDASAVVPVGVPSGVPVALGSMRMALPPEALPAIVGWIAPVANWDWYAEYERSRRARAELAAQLVAQHQAAISALHAQLLPGTDSLPRQAVPGCAEDGLPVSASAPSSASSTSRANPLCIAVGEARDEDRAPKRQRKGRWSKTESRRFEAAVEDFGLNHWEDVAARVQTRTVAQVRVHGASQPLGSGARSAFETESLTRTPAQRYFKREPGRLRDALGRYALRNKDPTL